MEHLESADRLGRPLTLRTSVCVVVALIFAGGCNFYYDLDSAISEPTEEDSGGLDACCDAGDAPDTPGDVADDALDTRDVPDRPDASDAADVDDVSDTPDASDTADSPDIVEDVTDDADTADVDGGDPPRQCRNDFGDIDGDCNPFLGINCPSGSTCDLTVTFDDNSMPEEFVTFCRNDSSFGSVAEGDDCSTSNCQPGLHCLVWNIRSDDPRGKVCSKPCSLETGERCGPDEFCTNPDELLAEFGFCTRECDPTNVASCVAGQRCTPDPNFPDDTCLPKFRCMLNGGATGKNEGDGCTIEDTSGDGCPIGMVCFEDPRDAGVDACLTPCSNDGDCDSGKDCVAAAAPWDFFKYCEL